MRCPACGFECQPDFAFCPRCGGQLAAPAAEPVPDLMERLQRLVPRAFADQLLSAGEGASHERRTVTMLFCDIKGSTAMAESLDPEDVLEIMNGAFEVLIEPVVRYEGTLARLMGDAILAFFGAPVTHEDDPERACRAALEILEGAQQYAARLKAERGFGGFNVRVGIHTGLVVVGEVGSDLRSEYTAMGDAVNLAARMEQAAEPGTVLISEATHRLVAPLFETETLGPLAVKGKAEAVSVFRVLSTVEGAGKPRGIAGLASPLVGRETEFSALKEALARLQEGEGGVASIVGEAGIGKSRLVAELRNYVVAHGDVAGAHRPAPRHEPTETVGVHGRAPSSAALHVPPPAPQWVEGRCLSYGASLAYQVWLDVLRGLLGVTHDDTSEAVNQALRDQVHSLCPGESDAVYPYLARLLSLPLDQETADRLDELDGRSLQQGIFSAVETLLSCAVRQRPLVVVCEDLHWADPTSLQLLERLLPLTDRLPLLVLCVSRSVQEHRVWGLLQTIAQDYGPSHSDLVLHPLSEDEGLVLVSNLLWVDELPPYLKDRILGRAEGNPFYLEEILRSLIDQGAIVQDVAGGRWQAAVEVEELLIPDTLEGVLVARIDRLPEATRQVLQLASVIGRVFLGRLLAEIVPAAQSGLRLDRRLEALQREDLIRERARLPELEYIFKHDLTREAAYNGLLKRDRVTHHRQVGEALEQLYPERLEEQLGLLAYHWEQAGVAAKAVDYMQRAGDQARLAYALTEAVDYYERALAFLRQGQDPGRTARLLMKLGLACHNAFRYEDARRAYEEGFALWQRAAKVPPASLPPAPHALRLAAWFPSSLDPAQDYHALLPNLFSGLVDLMPDSDVVPDVAQSWEILDGGCTYVFHLRDDVTWSDGVPVTASDFEFAWKRVLDPAAAANGPRLLYDIKGARAYHQGEVLDPDAMGIWARDDRTLVVELESPVAHFLQILTCMTALPVPRHVVQACGQAWTEIETIVTNGPFQVQARDHYRSLILARNPRYHGRFSGNVQRVEFTGLAAMQEREIVSTYEAGGLDHLYVGVLSWSEFLRAQRRNASDYLVAPVSGLFYCGFDVTRPPFDDARVRRAFARATDMAVMVGAVWRIPTGGFVPDGMPGHTPGIGLPYDLEGARQLLAEAGYPGGQGFPEIESLLLPRGFGEPYRDLQQSQWVEDLGITMKWTVLPASEWKNKFLVDPPHTFVTLQLADYPDPDTMLRTSFAWDMTGWRNDAYIQLLEEARHTRDQGKRMNLYRQADRMLMEEAVVVPTEYGGHHWLVKPWLSRFPTAAVTERWLYLKDVVIEPH